MPILEYPIMGHKQNVLRPIVISVMKDLAKMTGMEPLFSNVPVYYLDDSGVRQEISKLRFESAPELIVEVAEEAFEQSIPMYQKHQPEFYPVFYDEDTKVDITPFYSNTVITFTISNRFTSRDAAKRWHSSMRESLRNALPGFQHNLEYASVLPRGMVFILNEVYKKVLEREPNTEQSFVDWMKKRFNPRLGTVSMMDGAQPELAISEVSHQVHGFFRFDGQPEEGEKVDGASSWIIGFDYELTVMKPMTLSVHYPVAVYNQLLPNVLLGLQNDGTPKVRQHQTEVPVENRHYTVSSMGLNAFSEVLNKELRIPSNGVCVPYWDEFYVEQRYGLIGTKRFCDFLILLDKEDIAGTVLLDLKSLPEVWINEEVLEFLLSEKPWLTIEGESLFQVTLFQWGKRREPIAVTINDNLEVVLNTKVSLKNLYHVRVSIYYDWDYLSDEAIDRIPDHIKDLVDEFLDKDNDTSKDPSKAGIGHLKTVQTFYTENYRGKIPYFAMREKENPNG